MSHNDLNEHNCHDTTFTSADLRGPFLSRDQVNKLCDDALRKSFDENYFQCKREFPENYPRMYSGLVSLAECVGYISRCF